MNIRRLNISNRGDEASAIAASSPASVDQSDRAAKNACRRDRGDSSASRSREENRRSQQRLPPAGRKAASRCKPIDERQATVGPLETNFAGRIRQAGHGRSVRNDLKSCQHGQTGDHRAHKCRTPIPNGLAGALHSPAPHHALLKHDAAIVFPPGEKPYILVVLTGAIADEAKANGVIAEVSRAVWEERAVTR